MRLFKIVSIVLALLFVSGAAHARKDELVDPAPVEIPQGLTDKQVNREIQRSLLGRGWNINQAKPRDIESTLFLRDHQARIRVSWDDKQVRVTYLDSSNLNYEEKRGKRYIHPNYLNWMNYLQNDFKANLTAAQIDNLDGE